MRKKVLQFREEKKSEIQCLTLLLFQVQKGNLSLKLSGITARESRLFDKEDTPLVLSLPCSMTVAKASLCCSPVSRCPSHA